MKRSSSSSSSSIETIPSPQPTPTKYAPKKSASFEFPTSPQLILGGEMVHFSHPQHALAKVILPDHFTCAGCKEAGAGKRYICPQCNNYQLHEFCALSPPALKTHPYHLQHTLLFHSKPGKGGIMKSKCDVCAKSTKGYSFKCTACSFQMHPCCAMLSSQMKFPTIHPHTLKLLPATSSTETFFVCEECKKKRSGRVYGCTVCDHYYLHAVCAKNMINGLHANGIKEYHSGKPNMLGTAARFASLVVSEFIGGLIEGLGEGIGEALVDSVTRGPAPTTTTTTRTRN
ncbi:hypothetical protein ACFE04_025714 [Oxalis oulophora]